ncbi:MAG: hypothetical protein FJW22_01640 [Acidimicrobiia bacterium]|nr:hypothetical protein [Acidimicrobiia bacterium]
MKGIVRPSAVNGCQQGGEAVVRTLSRGRHVVIRNHGHPIGNAEACIGRMISQFLDRGSADGIDIRCAAEIPVPPFDVSR